MTCSLFTFLLFCEFGLRSRLILLFKSKNSPINYRRRQINQNSDVYLLCCSMLVFTCIGYWFHLCLPLCFGDFAIWILMSTNIFWMRKSESFWAACKKRENKTNDVSIMSLYFLHVLRWCYHERETIEWVDITIWGRRSCFRLQNWFRSNKWQLKIAQITLILLTNHVFSFSLVQTLSIQWNSHLLWKIDSNNMPFILSRMCGSLTYFVSVVFSADWHSQWFVWSPFRSDCSSCWIRADPIIIIVIMILNC